MAMSQYRVAETHRKIRAFDPDQFEEFLADLWSRRGYSAMRTQASNDGGIDVIAEKTFPFPQREVIQAKHRSTGGSVCRETAERYGRLSRRSDNGYAILITNGEFTSGAQEVAAEDHLKLIDGDTLYELIDRANAYDILDSYYTPPRITDVEEMLDLIDSLGQMERTGDNIVPRGTNNRLDCYRNAIKGLFNEGFLSKSDLPLPTDGTSGTRNLLNTRPTHADGSEMKRDERTEILPGVWLNHHDNYADKNDRLRYLAEYCVEKMTP